MIATKLKVRNSTLEIKLLEDTPKLAGEFVRDETNADVNQIIRLFNADYASGRAEQVLGIPRYSLSDMAEVLSRTRSAIPRSYHMWEKIDHDLALLTSLLNPRAIVHRGRYTSLFEHDSSLPRYRRREIEKEIRKLEEKGEKLWRYLKSEYGIGEPRKFLYEVVPFLSDEEASLQGTEIGALLRGTGIFFTKEEVVQTLEGFNLGAFVKFIKDRNFV